MAKRSKAKRLRRLLQQQVGFSVIEMMIAVGVLGAVVMGSMSLQNSVMETTQRSNDRAFATEKAVQMYEEVRAFVEANLEEESLSLNDYSDGVSYNWLLTADPKATDPGSQLSRNIYHNGHWKYVRQIQIEPVKNDEYAKKVTVKVWYGDAAQHPVGNPLAAITGILKTNIPQTPPSQVFDYYTVAIANAPGWWAESFDFRPAYEAVTTDLEFRNPGLFFRKNYITSLGFGRDPYYLPHTNTATIADSAHLPWVYYYPGKVKALNGTWANQTKEAYVYDDLRLRLRGDTEATWFHVSEKANGYTKYRPGAFSDHFNHVMRYPELKAMSSRVKDWALAMPDSATTNNRDMQKLQSTMIQPTLTEFLEDLNSTPDRFRHALITNIHAEQTPLPPVRNFADPARMPADDRLTTSDPQRLRYLNKRVVTHPERLHYENNEDITFRVHAFQVPPFGQGSLDYNADGTQKSNAEIVNESIDVISLFLPTDGPGRHPLDPSADGYLDNPEFTPSSADLSKVKLHKVVGSFNRKYEWMSMDTNPSSVPSGIDPDYTNRPFMVLTDEDIYDETISTSDNSATGNLVQGGVQRVGNRLVYASGNQVVISHRETLAATTAITTSEDDAYFDLLNQTIVVSASQNNDSNREGQLADSSGPLRVINVQVNRDQSGTRNGRVTLTLNRNLTNPITSVVQADNPIRVTRRRDYAMEVNPTVFGQTRDGILIKLYDTPTRHERHDNSYNGSFSPALFATSNTGLNPVRRLYGLEYIPAPVNTKNTTTDISDDFRTDLTDLGTNATTYANTGIRGESASNVDNRARNTARWAITLDISGESDFDDQLISLETRLGDNLEDGINADGDTHVPNATDSSQENRTTLRSNPYNVSRTYVYREDYYSNLTGGDANLPKVESYQYIGDPRYMPYADLKQEHAYNPYYFKADGGSNPHKFGWGGNGAGDNSWGGYEGFDRQKGNYSNVGHIEADLPNLFSLYSDGIMQSNAVYNTIAGYTNYIYSMGGEFGNRGNHNYRYEVKPEPWFATTPPYTKVSIEEGSNADRVAEQGSNTSQRVITAATERSGANGDGRWFARPYLGELFPDELYDFWRANGNLPDTIYSEDDNLDEELTGMTIDAPLPGSINGVTAVDFFREKQQDSPISLVRRERIAHEGAVSDFYNGSGVATSSIDDRLIHSTNGGSGLLSSSPSQAGRYLSDAFNLSLPDSIGSDRSWCLSKNDWCHNGHTAAADEYTRPERRAKRNTLSYINITGPDQGQATDRPSANTSFYLFSGNTAKNVSSGIFKLERKAIAGYVTADPDMVGYAVINGFQQAADFGAQSLARLSVAATLQAYMEAGDRDIPGDATGRIVPIPRVDITQPQTAKIETGNSINVAFDVSWLRWDGEKYSPSYPASWRDSMGLKYNAMYSDDNGTNWKYISGNSVLDRHWGYYNDAEPLFPGTPVEALSAQTEEKTFSWDITGFPNGNYRFRVEAYRDGRDNGYGYHEIFVTIKH